MREKIIEVLKLIEDPDLGPKLDILSILVIGGSEETGKICEEIRHEMVEEEKARLDSMFVDDGVTSVHSDSEDEDLL